MNRRSPREHRGRREDKRGKQYGSRHSREHRFLLTENYFSFSNRSTGYIAGVFLRPLGSERRDSSARDRWRGRPPRAGPRTLAVEAFPGKHEERRLLPSPAPPLPASVPLRFREGRVRRQSALGSSLLSRQNLKAPLKTVLLESLGSTPVVKRIVGVEPVAFLVYLQVRDLGDLVVLDQKLPFGNQRGNEVDFRLVQMKLVPVQLAIHIRVGEEDFCGTGFDNYVNNIRLPQLIKRLGGQNHRRILFAPGLQCFDDVALDVRISKEGPCFIDEECLEDVRDFAVGDDVVRAMEDVEQERLKNLRVLLHPLKIEALKARKTYRVFGIVKEESELPTARPFVKLQ